VEPRPVPVQPAPLEQRDESPMWLQGGTGTGEAACRAWRITGVMRRQTAQKRWRIVDCAAPCLSHCRPAAVRAERGNTLDSPIEVKMPILNVPVAHVAGRITAIRVKEALSDVSASASRWLGVCHVSVTPPMGTPSVAPRELHRRVCSRPLPPSRILASRRSDSVAWAMA
jgi:hypothetical protein